MRNIISVVATKSGMGKTTLVEHLISIFSNKGYRVGALKHDSHKLDIDKKGKDSYRFTQAGASDVVIVSSDKLGLIKTISSECNIESALNLIKDVDLIFVEGFKKNKYPKIEVHRKGMDEKFLFNNEEYDVNTFLAIATDEKVDGILNLDINNLDEIVGFIENYITKGANEKHNQQCRLVYYKEEKSVKVHILKIENEVENIEEKIISDYPLSLILNNEYVDTFVCSPYNMEELVTGYLASKGFIKTKDDILKLHIDKSNGVSHITIKDKNQLLDKDEKIICLNSIDYLKYKEVESDITVNQETIYNNMEMNLSSSKLFKDTGCVHSIAIFDKDKEVTICEDVARHNAMDKAIGYCVLNGISLKDKIVMVSGRISFDMLLKAAQMQIPIVVSKSAPTNLSIELSKKLNITLIGFVRGRKMNIYTNPQRITL